jgi:hypothetical protein
MFPPSHKIDRSHLPTTTSLSSRQNTIAATGEPPSTLTSLLVRVRARKVVGPMRRELWMLTVNSCSPPGHWSHPTGHAMPLAPAAHAMPNSRSGRAGSHAPVGRPWSWTVPTKQSTTILSGRQAALHAVAVGRTLEYVPVA